jgi:hypothetical protein
MAVLGDDRPFGRQGAFGMDDEARCVGGDALPRADHERPAVGLVTRANRFAVTVRPAVRGPVANDRISITPDGKVLLSRPDSREQGSAVIAEPACGRKGPRVEATYDGRILLWSQ